MFGLFWTTNLLQVQQTQHGFVRFLKSSFQALRHPQSYTNEIIALLLKCFIEKYQIS